MPASAWIFVVLGALEAVAGGVWVWLRRWFARGLRPFRVEAVRPLPSIPRVPLVAGTVVDERTGEERELLRTTVPVLAGDVARCRPAGGGRARLLPTPRTALPGTFLVRGALLVVFGVAVGRTGLDEHVTGGQNASYLFVAWLFTLFGAVAVGIAAGRLRFARHVREVEGHVVDERRWLNRAPSEPKVRYTAYGRTRSAWAGRYSFRSPRPGKPVVVLLDPRTEAVARRVGGSFGLLQFFGVLAGLLGALQFVGALGLLG
ncbi:hypothetical protein [Amycolatopsis sp. NPDC049159]|uniref:hypothetical protein n=1 Tax=Amycolatopsis sp. NPDC049159 TaxID=3157210 RepID=UPI0033CFA8A1